MEETRQSTKILITFLLGQLVEGNHHHPRGAGESRAHSLVMTSHIVPDVIRDQEPGY